MHIRKIDSHRLSPGTMHFNPSVCRHGEKILMTYRLEDRSAKSWSQIALCELDDEWQPIQATNRLLPIPEPVHGTNLFEDPRLYSIGDDLILTFIAARFSGRQHVAAQGICLIKKDLSGIDESSIHYPKVKNNVNYAIKGQSTKMVGEKNWTLIHLASFLEASTFLYTVHPTVVVSGEMDYKRSKADIVWPHGRLSGSTPLINWNGKLLGCFHSFLHAKDGQRDYFAGWYVIDPETWRLIAYSKEPILRGERDEDDRRPEGSKWTPRAVFPCGIIDLGDKIAISYGWLDSTCRMAFFDYQEIESNLCHVTKWFREAEMIRNPWGGIPGGFTCTIEGDKLKASSWPGIVRKAKKKGISSLQLHEAFCSKIDPIYKITEWVDA